MGGKARGPGGGKAKGGGGQEKLTQEKNVFHIVILQLTEYPSDEIQLIYQSSFFLGMINE